MHGSIYEFDGLPSFGKPLSRPAGRDASRGRAVPLVGIVRNPRSHRNKGHEPELADCSNILTETPRTREDLRAVLIEFARRGIDHLVVDGGDGTVRDVLSCGADVFGEDWPSLIVLPKGKTNALTIDLGLPADWTLADALAAAQAGRTVERRPLRISPEGRSGCVQGFILGAGLFSLATDAGQEAHRRGAFNGLAVAAAVLWAILQTIFGRNGNAWRKPVPMRLRFARSGKELPHAAAGDPGERFLLVGTTFQNFPFGARPFGRHPRPGMKLALIDWPHRWLFALLPAIIYGFYPRFLERFGARRFHADAMDFELGGSFIVDGEAFPPGSYRLSEGPRLTFVVP